MRIGFTGSRSGMALLQWATCTNVILEEYQKSRIDQMFPDNEWHDGDCIGSDDQAHGFVDQIKEAFNITTYGHPCNLEKQRAYRDFDTLMPVDAPLTRNRTIVNSTELLIAAPREYNNVPRGSGTWATIRYAYRNKRRMVICWPDGSKVEYAFEDAEHESLFD